MSEHQPSSPPGRQLPQPRRKNWFAQNPGKTVALGIVGGLLVIGSIASAEDDGSSRASHANFDASSQKSDGGDRIRSTRKQQDRRKAQPNKRLQATGGEFVMPQTSGMDLQLAQDTLQSVSGNALFYSESVDATGAGRGQWLDSGWRVCWSEPAAGQVVRQSDTPTFAVVRVSEDCP